MPEDPAAGPERQRASRPFYYPYPLTIAGCIFWIVFLLLLVLVILYFRPGRAAADTFRTVTISADTLDIRRGARRVAAITGLAQPESVVHDTEQDVYFVSNMRGAGSDRNNAGYIVRIHAADRSRMDIFARGGVDGVTLHAPKGLVLGGDVLWAADIDVIRGFDRRTGRNVANLDLSGPGAVMLNALTVDPAGTLYVTDTGIVMTDHGVLYPRGDRVFAIERPASAQPVVRTVAEGPQLELPNGIAWDAANGALVVASFNPFSSEVYALAPDGAKRVIGRGPGRFDGLQLLEDGRIVTTSWVDHSLHVFHDGRHYRIATNLHTAADLGVDYRRNLLLVPLVLPGRLELWEITPRHGRRR